MLVFNLSHTDIDILRSIKEMRLAAPYIICASIAAPPHETIFRINRLEKLGMIYIRKIEAVSIYKLTTSGKDAIYTIGKNYPIIGSVFQKHWLLPMRFWKKSPDFLVVIVTER